LNYAFQIGIIHVNANLPAIALQVSICKFKFTGGAKPTLEEKKMLSVDAVGNFRYFTGSQQQQQQHPVSQSRSNYSVQGSILQSSVSAIMFLGKFTYVCPVIMDKISSQNY
jgi:hypothetical protein